MITHIYAFGSICRGEIDASSDVDLLAITEDIDPRFDPNQYSIYSHARMDRLWKQGNPFAWHLYMEARLIYASDKCDFLKSRGKPSKYQDGVKDCKKFRDIFLSAVQSLEQNNQTEIYDLSIVFLSMRNFATCYSLHGDASPNFSRHSAKGLGENRIELPKNTYILLERARILCTRGKGSILSDNEIQEVRSSFRIIKKWMDSIIERLIQNERI